ncbi:hypothetical protein B0J14DRAFT_529868 [Halenospora varia]|nr:hypothetical protein B0J14DRAFT_529868 [Halenospora varia]
MGGFHSDKSMGVPVIRKHPPSKQTTTNSTQILLAALVFSAVIFGFVIYTKRVPPFGASTGTLTPSNVLNTLPDSFVSTTPMDDSNDFSRQPWHPKKRYSLKYGQLACWQHEGVWIVYLTPVELAAIGVNRFQDTQRSLNQTEEDEFCARIRMFGASFWSLPPHWPEDTDWCESIDDCVEPDRKFHLFLGFPENGGVWVLDRSKIGDELYTKSKGLLNALIMEERCNVIRGLGGKYCESMQACPETAALVEN